MFGHESVCLEHEKVCPQKDEYLKKLDSSHQKFSKNKKWIKKNKEDKREMDKELGGNVNAPDSKEMHTLKYQYGINNPFVGG